jgi:hypothetical protein
MTPTDTQIEVNDDAPVIDYNLHEKRLYEAVEKERERCARVVETFGPFGDIAAAIRALKDET